MYYQRVNKKEEKEKEEEEVKEEKKEKEEKEKLSSSNLLGVSKVTLHPQDLAR